MSRLYEAFLIEKECNNLEEEEQSGLDLEDR